MVAGMPSGSSVGKRFGILLQPRVLGVKRLGSAHELLGVGHIVAHVLKQQSVGAQCVDLVVVRVSRLYGLGFRV